MFHSARYFGMPAKSKKQQMAAGAALSAKRGQRPKGSLKGASRSMEKSMNEKQLRDLAKTKRKSLPKKETAGKQGAAKKSATKKTSAAKKKR
jgi:hypothetical protein